MLYIMAILLGLLFGLLLKGKISNFYSVSIDKAWIFITAFTLMILLQLLVEKFEIVAKLNILILVVVYLLIVTGVWFNRKYIGIWSICLGCILNGLVILLNNGKMPVSPEAVSRTNVILNTANIDAKHAIIQSGVGTKLSFLADNIYVPGWFGYLMRIVSKGDLFVVIGLFLVVLQIVTGWRVKKVDN